MNECSIAIVYTAVGRRCAISFVCCLSVRIHFSLFRADVHLAFRGQCINACDKRGKNESMNESNECDVRAYE